MDELPLLDQPPRERADAARNRALVLQAAWRLYNAGGVEALTTDAVAQEAGVGKGTVYRRFRDKSGLVAALLDDKEKELQLAMISGPAPLGPNGPQGSEVGGASRVGGATAGAVQATAETDVGTAETDVGAAQGAIETIAGAAQATPGTTAGAAQTTAGTTAGAVQGPTEPIAAAPAPTHPARRTAFVHAYLDYLQAHLDLLVASETAAPGARYRLGVYQFWKTHLTLLFSDTLDPEFRAYTLLALLDAGLVHHLRTEGWSWDRIRAGVEQEALR